MVAVVVDCIAGPTYHFGGLAYGNVHSMTSKHLPSSPKQVALDGLHKMKVLADKGVKQFVLPPYKRDVDSLIRKASSKSGPLKDQLADVYYHDRQYFSDIFSCPSIWVANAWTATASVDSYDRCVHITPANLASNRHRSLDVAQTQAYLNQLCAISMRIHSPISDAYGDEGAANLIRFSNSEKGGLYLCVSGNARGMDPATQFPIRHDYRAWKQVMTVHKIDPSRVIYVQQHPMAIDAGVFHNDVIAFGLDDIWVVHQRAYVNQDYVLDHVSTRYQSLCKKSLKVIQVDEAELSLSESVSSYFFNSQLVRISPEHYVLLLPSRCRGNGVIERIIDRLKRQWHVSLDCLYCDVEQSIYNGGGPACLRNMMECTQDEYKGLNPAFKFSEKLYETWCDHIQKYYSDDFYLEHCLSAF